MHIKSRIYQANLKKKFQKTREKNMGIIQPIRKNFHIQNFRHQFNLKAHISHPLPSKKHTTPDLKEQNCFWNANVPFQKKVQNTQQSKVISPKTQANLIPNPTQHEANHALHLESTHMFSK